MTADSPLVSRNASYSLMLLKTLVTALAALVLVLALYGYSTVGIYSLILLVGLPSLYFVFKEWRNLYLVLNDRVSDLKLETPEPTAMGAFDKMYSRVSKRQIAVVDFKGSHVTVVLDSPLHH